MIRDRRVNRISTEYLHQVFILQLVVLQLKISQTTTCRNNVNLIYSTGDLLILYSILCVRVFLRLKNLMKMESLRTERINIDKIDSFILQADIQRMKR